MPVIIDPRFATLPLDFAEASQGDAIMQGLRDFAEAFRLCDTSFDWDNPNGLSQDELDGSAIRDATPGTESA